MRNSKIWANKRETKGKKETPITAVPATMTQKERKITTLYVESYGKKYDSEFKIQMTKTDESTDMLNKFMKSEFGY